MKVLITGGAGYIGSHTNRYLSEQGIETIVLDSLEMGHREAVKWGTFIKGDIADDTTVRGILSEQQIESVIHFAGYAIVPESINNPALYYRTNVAKMQSLLDSCVACGVKRFVFSSSSVTFGDAEYLPIDENHPQIPTNPYGHTKLIGEQMLKDYEAAYGIKHINLRYFCAAGDSHDSLIGESHDPETRLIPRTIIAAMSGEVLRVFGNDYDTRDGSAIRDFVHVEDLAEAHGLALQHLIKKDSSDSFNLGSENGFTVFEVIKEVEHVLEKPVHYEIVARRTGDAPALVASNSKAKTLLNWNPSRSSIERIILDAYNWQMRRNY
jgi:UDP-glucose 4-epimerase